MVELYDTLPDDMRAGVSREAFGVVMSWVLNAAAEHLQAGAPTNAAIEAGFDEFRDFIAELIDNKTPRARAARDKMFLETSARLSA